MTQRFISIALFISFFLIPSVVFAESGTAYVYGTNKESNIRGIARFKDLPKGLGIRVHVQNVSPGKHGIHIHEFAACMDSGKAAGGHFNPKGVKHGLLAKNGPKRAHAGDLGNIVVGPGGKGVYKAVIPGLTLSSGKTNVAGRALILHQKEDTFGQPTGDAGVRIGCGSIRITGK